MWPILVELKDYTLGTYGVLVAIGMLTALAVARHLGKRDALDPREVNDIGLGIIFLGFLSSKLLGFLVDVLSGRELGLSELRTAGVIHGGLAGALIGTVVLARYFKMPLPPLLDAFVPATALGQAIGRLGCFAAGCCFGTPSDASWAVTFTSPDAAALGGTPLHQALHPVQLYDALAHVVLFAGLLVLHRRMQFRGRLLGLWCVAEGFTRFFIESFRGDGGRGLWLDSDWLSTGRITALLMMALGAYLLQRLPEWSPPPTDAEQKSPKSSASSRKSRRKPKTEGVSQHNEPD